MQRVAEQEIRVGISVADVKLNRDLLTGSLGEGRVQQRVEQWLVAIRPDPSRAARRNSRNEASASSPGHSRIFNPVR